MDSLKPILKAACERPLSKEEAHFAFTFIMEGHASDIEIASFLTALRMRGESSEEIIAAARVMRAVSLKVNAPDDAIDIVGTGGDGKGSLNISTATAFVVAGTGQIVAKHGNKNLSSQSGAADALSLSGVNVMVDASVVERAIADVGIGFMMAPMHHPAMKYVMPVRIEMGIRTIYNILGPLTNPASVKYQLTGAFSPEFLRPMAETLHALGVKRAWLVHGSDGTDEISISGSTQCVALENGAISEREIHPEDAGLPIHPFDTIIGGTPQENAAAMNALLKGEPSAYRDAVLLNSAAALVIAEKADNLPDAVEMARASIESGKALEKLEHLARLTQEAG